MLDNTTKKRIDDCRDILVGKLPDPKSQIEQITIALIYKFMDDMDREAIELGGNAKFFSDDFEKYSWDNLFNARVTAIEMLKLYSESIESMEKNPNIPQLFRDIFKNAYLPYRDPETLKLFLKTIGEFEYTHSEKLGDAFEYLLSVMGSQGDAGQFRTPRHIIDFLVVAVAPSKTDTILDPACGTAGFLISAFKRIKEKNNNQLTPDERKKLIKNFIGYDISPDMVRLSLVNLYLHGFSNPHIFEYDTLTSEERWNDNFDVILANPPFMSPKGGIRPHKKFTVSSNRSEVLFVDYIAEHLNPKGRAGIIVPEGVIFQSGKAYKELRKMLVENYLYAVVSLPAGVFNPYSGVKTSILLMDRGLAKKTNKILFVKIDNDGYNLGAQRTEIKGGQLGEAIEIINNFKKSIKNNTDFENIELAHAVEVSKIAENGGFNLSGSRYIESLKINSEFEKVKLIDVLDYEQPTNYIVESTDYNDNFEIPVLTAGKSFILGYTNENYNVFQKNLPVIIFDDFTTATKYVDFPFKVKSSAMKILKLKDKNANIKLVYYLMQNIKFDASNHKRYWISIYSQIEIPLPPLIIQEEIVSEIESYQKIIDGAKMVVENYKPKIDIDPDWKMVELSQLIKLSSGKGLTAKNMIEGQYPVYGGNGINGHHNEYFLDEPTIVIGRVGAYCGVVHITQPKSWITDNGLFVTHFLKEIEMKFLSQLLTQLNLNRFAKVGGQPSISQKTVTDLKVSVPDLAIQKKIVNQLKVEQELVNSSKQIIVVFKQKIKDRIAKVWGE